MVEPQECIKGIVAAKNPYKTALHEKYCTFNHFSPVDFTHTFTICAKDHTVLEST